MSEYRGAAGSNTGDDFHELWATSQVLRLLWHEDDLQAVAVEGLAKQDHAGTPQAAWDGVDCALYYGGTNAAEATRIALVQLKYSGSSPSTLWTVARFVAGESRGRSVIARLARAWQTLRAHPNGNSAPIDLIFVSNQSTDPALNDALVSCATTCRTIPARKPRSNASAEQKLAYAAGLDADDFQSFCKAIQFQGQTGSRFALEERLHAEVSKWTDQNVQAMGLLIRTLVRNRMRPEAAGEAITRDSILLQLGTTSSLDLFPCPSEITRLTTLVTRDSIRSVVLRLQEGAQYVCLHGGAGAGKTTALQEVEANLAPGSVMIDYDCYGAGRYLDPSALRHRTADAFLQLTNELAYRLRLPLLLTRRADSNYPRLFMTRLRHAAAALAAERPDALVVIAIDAADNAVFAASNRIPPEPSFVHDFVSLTDLPTNVRFVVTARTGRLPELKLPARYIKSSIGAFTRQETAEHVRQRWAGASDSWIDDFHHLSAGVPRVQAYAFEVDGQPAHALDRLRPTGKSLHDIFQGRFDDALTRHGNQDEVTRLCAGLSALPRPIPMVALVGVLGSSVAILTDICGDLAPGIRIREGLASFADEDFEDFVRAAGAAELSNVQQTAATWLAERADHDEYAAMNVAPLLVATGRGAELLELVETEANPVAISDSLLRREVESQRLRLAIKVCREANDVPRALHFVLIGAEGVNTEAALHDLLAANPDLAACFAKDTAGRLILASADDIEGHGSLLFQKLSVDASRKDAISVREGLRLLDAWMQARKLDLVSKSSSHAWPITTLDIASAVYAILNLDGTRPALEYLYSWGPASIRIQVALALSVRMIAEDRSHLLEAVIADEHLDNAYQLFLLNPLALAGIAVSTSQLARSLAALCRHKLHLRRFFADHQYGASVQESTLDAALLACEILVVRRGQDSAVDSLLAAFGTPEFRRIDQRYSHESGKLDLLLRAFVLEQLCVGKTPSIETFFELRPKAAEEDQRPHTRDHDAEHDREIKELVGAVMGIYTSVAKALITPCTDEALAASLRQSIQAFSREKWRIESRHDFGAMRENAAKYIATLLATQHSPALVMEFVLELHGHWKTGYEPPSQPVFERLTLRKELHAALLRDLALAATEAAKHRMGGDEKSKLLVGYARFAKPISEPDADAIFRKAIEAAGEIDREVMSQIKLLNTLWARGARTLTDPRSQALTMSELIDDASVRLGDDKHFPWGAAMSALVHLDVSVALGNTARWHDDNRVSLIYSLPPLLRTALETRALTPAQVSALALFYDDNRGVQTRLLSAAASASVPYLLNLVEEVAHDALLRIGERTNEELSLFIEQQGIDGHWVGAWRRQAHFVSPLSSTQTSRAKSPRRAATENESAVLSSLTWDTATLLDRDRLYAAVERVRTEATDKKVYLSFQEIVGTAVSAVPPRHRTGFLNVLAELKDAVHPRELVSVLLGMIKSWEDSPAVTTWCRTGLPPIIVAGLPDFAGYLCFGTDDITPALQRTGLSDSERQSILLQGIERHADNLNATAIFALAELVGASLSAADAANLASWYLQRVAQRIPDADRKLALPEPAVPKGSDEGVARFLFAYMGDYDLRLRWRAAHAARRLARLGDKETLIQLREQYSRREDPVFRNAHLPFYWLAARLWFVITWDRIATENADCASVAGGLLRDIAFDVDFPHLLIRSFARDACQKLIQTGHLILPDADQVSLRKVAKTSIPRKSSPKSRRQRDERAEENRRVSFDTIDTIPYWYSPIVSCFAELDLDRFLSVAERWIVDVWQYGDDTHQWNKEPRRHYQRDWALSSHRHGENPTLERLRTHLEWHAMWCAAGELLQTEPLRRLSKNDWNMDDLEKRTANEKLSAPPLWCADLLGPVPLVLSNWAISAEPVREWAASVDEATHRAELLPYDRNDFVVVESYIERSAKDRKEVARVSTALVTPLTADALVRTLQSMEDSWDYKIPSEGEDMEINQLPYQLIGWLAHDQGDASGLDVKDPLRGRARTVETPPGRKVTEACALSRDGASPVQWANAKLDEPMFIYEVWGSDFRDEEVHSDNLIARGHRLLANKKQLQSYLSKQKLDLIVEVEVTRDEREGGRYVSEKETKVSEKFDRLYRIRSSGELRVAEGYLGSWSNDC